MRDKNRDLDRWIDEAAAAIRADSPPAADIEAAGERVWKRLAEDSASAAAAAEVDRIESCADYQRLLPALREGTLSPARKVLTEDHLRECVPCRRALKSLDGTATAVETGRPAAEVAESRASSIFATHWLKAAAIVAVAVLGPFLVWQMSSPSGPAMVVAATDGALFQVAESGYRPLAAGGEVDEKERVRTGHGVGAVMRLRDGSRIEMRERSEISVRESRRGTTVELGRGSVIIEAAQQSDRKLFVATDDCLVSVTGTIFSVNHGTKGSRVSVIEGEVRVDLASGERVLGPGNQLATHASLRNVPLEDEIAWSRNVDAHIALLRELVELEKELQASLPQPALRYDSRLLERLPAETVFFASAPNFSETLAEARRIIERRIAGSAVLGEWWSRHLAGGDDESPGVWMDRLSELGRYLGDEIIVSGQMGEGDDEVVSGFVLLSEVADASGFRALLESELAGHGEDDLVFVDSLDQPATGDDRFYLWLGNGLLVGSPDVERIRQVVAGGSGFDATPFHDQILSLYAEGAGIVVASDLERLVARGLEVDGDADNVRNLDRLGFGNVRHFLFEQKQQGDRTSHRAVVSFNEGRRGVASWLAAPAPMGSLDFVSPEAKLVTAAVFKDPTAMLDDIDALFDSVDEGLVGEMQQIEREYGLSLREDVAAALGGEVAVAIDGPVLPKPAWKMVLEVYDAERVQWAIETALAEVSRVRAEVGKGPIELTTTDSGGRTFYSIAGELAGVTYTFSEGYLIAGPSRALVDRALRYRDSGQSIVDADGFSELLPNDGRPNFSALVFQDMSALIEPLANGAIGGALSEEQRQAIEELSASRAPLLAYAYGEDDRIIFAAESELNLISSSLLNLLGLEHGLSSGALFPVVDMPEPVAEAPQV